MINYKEYPIFAVFCKVESKSKKADMMSELNKVYKTLRELSK